MTESTRTSHPTIHLGKIIRNYLFGTLKPIQLKAETSDRERAFIKLEKQLRKFKAACDDVTKAYFGAKEIDAITKEVIEDYRLEIILSAISEEFQKLHKDQLNTFEDSEKLIKFLKNSFDTQTEEEKSSAAEQKLRSMTRRVEMNERFSCFYDRLMNTARLVDKNTEIQKHIVKTAFKSNLTPKLKEFLIIQGKNDLETEELAAYLDEKQQYKASKVVNQIQTEKMEGKIETLETEIRSLSKLMEKLLEQKSEENAQINAMKVSKREHLPNQNLPRTDRQYGWELNKFGKPFRCHKCGLMGHRASNCLGLCKQICHICKKVGHLQSVCPQRSSKN